MLAANRRQAQTGIVSRGASHLAPLYLICRGPRVCTGFSIGASDGGPFCPLPAPCSRPLPSCGAVSPITGCRLAGRLFCSHLGHKRPHKKAAVRISRASPASCTNQSTGGSTGKKKKANKCGQRPAWEKSLPPKNWLFKAKLRPVWSEIRPKRAFLPLNQVEFRFFGVKFRILGRFSSKKKGPGKKKAVGYA